MLFLTESFHPVLGGGERHIRQLGARLAAEGTAPLVLTRRTDVEWAENETLDGLRIRRVPPSGRGRLGKYRMVGAASEALIALRGEYDLLVVRGTRILGLPGVRAARRAGVPVVLQPEVNGELSGEIYVWGTPLDLRPVRAAVRALTSLRNRVLRSVDGVVAMSRAIETEALRAGFPRGRVHLIPHGVDVGRYRPANAIERRALRTTLGLPQQATILAYTGRLLRGKGLDALISAFAALAAEESPVHLLIVGSGDGQPLSVEERLRKEVARRDLSARVTFAGRVDAVEDWLRASDIFAFPSEFEALGLSLVEAAACGLPAVATRTGGIVDVVEDGRSGILVPAGKPAELVVALRRLVIDTARRAAMGEEARRVALSRFDEAEMFTRYRALFASLASPLGQI